MQYHHTQRGTLTIVVCLLLAALDAVMMWRSGQWPLAAVLILLLAVAAVFSSLTVEVSDNELRWHFGPGLWAYRVPLSDIQTVARCVTTGGTASASERGRASGSITCQASTPSNCALRLAISAGSAPMIRTGLPPRSRPQVGPEPRAGPGGHAPKNHRVRRYL